MIRLRHVYKSYGPGLDALKNVSLHVPRGEFLFVMGPSGAGKTTLLKLLYRAEVADRGSILVDGSDVTHLPEREVPYLRRRIGVVFQDFRLLPRRTVFENVAFAMRVMGAPTSEIRRRVRFVLHQVGLGRRMNDEPDLLSGGERQRVAVARAIVNRPDILLADEPTGHLDPDLANEMVGLFSLIHAGGTTILAATHDEMLVDRSKRPVIRMLRGRATAKDAASDFLNDAAPAGGGRQARGGIRREARR
ncbi:MAG: cell division ATP-binding protein FtsE [Nitrospinota bacterium]|nr:cell division ATP-binding protein FtsE [Nitrospinota bacterium]